MPGDPGWTSPILIYRELLRFRNLISYCGVIFWNTAVIVTGLLSSLLGAPLLYLLMSVPT